MAADARIGVLLVDDQDLMRGGLRVILESEPGIVVVGEAADGRAALAAVRAEAPDVVCMDVQMPVLDGLAATREIVESDPSARVLMLTTFDDDDTVFAALEAGASGFLLKTASPEALIDAVRVLASGDSLLSPEVTRRVVERSLHGRAPVGGDTGAAPALTAREREVLALVAKGCANAEIADRLFVGEATVKTHVSHTLLKLGLRDRVQLVVWAYEHGLVVPGA